MTIQATQQPDITTDNTGAIIIAGGNSRPQVTVKVDEQGIHLSQGASSTTIPIHDVVPANLVPVSWALAAIVGCLCIGLPISRAIARFIDRRGSALSQESELRRTFAMRFDVLERNLDTVAIELEKVSESQRFEAGGSRSTMNTLPDPEPAPPH